MHSFIMKISHSLLLKDTIGVARGVYKVVQGGFQASRQNKPPQSQSTWHRSPLRTEPLDNFQQQQSTTRQTFPQQQSTTRQTNEKFPSNGQKLGQTELGDNITKKVSRIPVNDQKVTESKLCTGQKAAQKNSRLPDDPPAHQVQKNQTSPPQELQTGEKFIKTVKSQPDLSFTDSTENNGTSQKLDSASQSYKSLLKELNEEGDNIGSNHSVVSKVPSSRLSRFFQFGKLGLNIAESAVQAYFTSGNDPSRQQAAYEKIANKISDELCKMRGAPLKLAQMLSIQEDKLIPAAIRKAFEKARQTAHILPPEQVKFMMQENFGKDWRKKFSGFQQRPFASASIGQVHRANVEGIGKVAIKIQYPGVRKSIESDINNLKFLMKIPGVFPKGLYMDKILKKTKQELTEECDYILEKEKQEAYSSCLEMSLKKELELFRVPRVYDDYTTEQIFTSQYLSGVSLKKLQEGNYPQKVKDEVGRRIMKITFNELFEMGIVQSDPNPSNFTFNFSLDQLNLFDFGATHIYRKEFLQNYYKIIQGSVKQDHNQILQASIDTGFLTGEESQAMKESHIQSILITGEPLRHVGLYDFGNQKITERLYKTIPYMLKNRLKNPPEQVYSLHRKLSGSYLACMRLKARVDCGKIWNDIKFQRFVELVDRSKKSKLAI